MPLPMILVLAAGASSRMRGADKLLQKVEGMPLLRRQAMAALASKIPVLVALPALPGPRDEALENLALERVRVEDAHLGMGHSIAAGAMAAMARGATSLMIMNADLPGLGTAEISTMLNAFDTAPGRIHIGTSASGALGHPVIFPGALLPELTLLRGDQGAKEIVRREKFLTVALPGDAATRDLDTPEDWALWRAETGL